MTQRVDGCDRGVVDPLTVLIQVWACGGGGAGGFKRGVEGLRVLERERDSIGVGYEGKRGGGGVGRRERERESIEMKII